MTFLTFTTFGLLILGSVLRVSGQERWCGKNYRSGQPVVEPGGAYPVPETTPANEPLLLFRCNPKFHPFIHGDDTKAIILVDLAITHTKMNGTAPFPNASTREESEGIEGSEFLVSISTEYVPLLAAQVMPLGLHQKLAFPLLAIIPQKRAHKLTCTARRIRRGPHKIEDNSLPGAFTAHTTLSYQLPNPNGSTVKMDSETRGLLVRTGENRWLPLIPYGFYTAFDNYLASNLSVLDAAARNLWVIQS